MRPTGSPEELERRRNRAIQLLRKGHQPFEVARMLGVDRRSVRRWKAAYSRGGSRMIKARPAPGRPAKLDKQQKKKLVKDLLQGAIAAGFFTNLWTCPRVVHLIKERYGVQYHVDHIGRLLHELGFSPQKPQRRAIERNEKEINRWVREEWPRIKKKPGA